MAHFRFAGLVLALLVSGGVAKAATSPPLMTTPGQFSVSPTGAGTYSIPIGVVPGTSGVVPSLSLSYSSQNGDGFVGLGWGLGGLPSITRCPRTLAQDSIHGSVNFDANDRFCLDGQRLMLISGTYGADGSQYRTEIESFSKITAHGSAGSGPSWFEVKTKPGQILELGHTADSQAVVIGAATGPTPPSGSVRKWSVSKVSDVVGNYMTVTYSCAPTGGGCVSGETYPTRIDYTGNASASISPYNSVRFEYTARAGTMPAYQAGAVVTQTAVLTNIKTYQGANLVQDYRLAYRAGNSTNTRRYHLTSVIQCDNASGCLPATTFGWQETATTSVSTVYLNLPGATTSALSGDWNGDGLTDLTFLSPCGVASSYPVLVGQSTFGFDTSAYSLPNPMPSGVWPFCFGPGVVSTILAPDGTSNVMIGVLGFKTSGPAPLARFYMSLMTSAGPLDLANYTSASLASAGIAGGDFNGDGYVDFFAADTPTSYAYLGNGSTFTTDGGTSAVNTTSSVLAGDYDGDGCTDILSARPTVGSATLVYAYNCSPAQASVTPPSTAGGYYVYSGDFNGDGKTDLLYTNPSSLGQMWLATGTYFVSTGASIPTGWLVVATGDWNGDGMTDLLVDASGGTGVNDLYLSTGTGFTPALDGMGNPVRLFTGSNVLAADWDNNGNTDLMAPDTTSAFFLIDYTPELMTSVSNGIGATTNIAYDRINTGGSFYSKGAAASYPLQNMIGPQYVVSEVNTSNGLGTCTPPSGTNCYRVAYTYQGAQKDLRGRGFLGFTTVVATDQQTSIKTTTNYSITFPYVGLVTSQTREHSGTTLSSTVNTFANNGSCGATPAGSGVYVDCLTQAVVSGNDLDGSPLPTTTTNYTYDNYGNALTVNVSVSDGSSKNTTNTYWNDTTNWFLGRLLTTSVNSIVGSSNQTRQSSFSYDSGTGLLTVESIEPGVSSCNAGADSCTLSTSYTYDAFGHRVTTTAYGTGITSRTSYAFYDSIGQFQTSAANALGQYEFWTYDSRFGAPATHTGPNFLTTSWTYDSFGRPAQETRPDGTKAYSTYGYCGGGCPTYGQFYATAQQLANDGATQIGPTSTSYFDMLSRGIAADTQGFDGSNIRIATVYDGKGNVYQTSRPYFTTGASPAFTTFTNDDLGRVTLATFPDGSDTAYGYSGMTTTVTNDLSQVTTTVKNAQWLNYQVTDAATNTTTYIYDAFGNLLTVTDPVGNVISNSFDIRGNKVASVDPDMGRWTYAYDVLAELTSQTDAKGQSTTLSYDVLGRALSRTEPGLYSEWTYGTSATDRNIGQLIRARACTASGCGTTVSDKTFLFDSTGRPSQTTIQTATDFYGYKTAYNGTNGQIASVTYPSGFVANRSYNSYGYLTQLTGPSGEVIWTGNARDAELHLTQQTAGNGVTTTQTFSAATGMIQNQRAGPSNSVASFDYSFDAIGNLATRTDNNQPYTERFCYDSLNRLTNYNIAATCAGKTIAYNAIGNITSKSDTGTYSYPSAGSNRPHAVTGITGTVDGLTNPNYSYDANGNLTCVSSGSGCSGTIGRTINVTSFNMAQSMVQGANSLSLTYDDQHQRISQANTVSGTSTTTTVYLNDPASGAMSERVSVSGTTPTVWNSFTWGAAPWGGTTANALPTWTDYIAIDGQIIAQRKMQYPLASAWGFQNWNAFTWGAPSGSLWGSTAPANPPRFKWGSDPWSGPVVTWAYFNLDHLGSVAVITDQGANVVQRLSFDAWGKQRNVNGTDATCGTISAGTTRGYTNQEEMPTQCLVNLNARIYDASIGKFMAADSIVPEPYDGQSFNRYSYVGNNPVRFIDTTGHYSDTLSDLRCMIGCASIVYYVPGGGVESYQSGAGVANVSGGSGKTSIVVPEAKSQTSQLERVYEYLSSGGKLVINGVIYGGRGAVENSVPSIVSNGIESVVVRNGYEPMALQNSISGTAATGIADFGAQNNCLFLCNMAGGPIDAKTAPGFVAGTYNHDFVSQGLQLTDHAATVASAVMPIPGAATAGIIFKTEHYASRLIKYGLDVNRVESLVAREVSAVGKSVEVGSLFSGRLTIDGMKIEYRAKVLDSGVTQVGTIFKVVQKP